MRRTQTGRSRLVRAGAIVAAVLLWATAADAACSWVLWRRQGESSRAQSAGLEVLDAFEKRGDCVKAIGKQESYYKERRYHLIDRTNETTLFVASRPAGENREEIHLACRPDTIDARGPKGK